MITNDNRQIRAMVAIVALIVAISLAAGCMWAPELSRVKNDIQQQIPGARFEKEFAMSIGPLSIGLAKIITSLVPDEGAREASTYLRHVSRVQVAIYNAHSMPPVAELRTPKVLEELLEEDGWELAVKVREDDNLVWVLYHIDDDTVRDLYVVVLGDEELVIVKARGRLEQLVARALQDSNWRDGAPDISIHEETF